MAYPNAGFYLMRLDNQASFELSVDNHTKLILCLEDKNS